MKEQGLTKAATHEKTQASPDRLAAAAAAAACCKAFNQ
jgi:hypothetical protein